MEKTFSFNFIFSNQNIRKIDKNKQKNWKKWVQEGIKYFSLNSKLGNSRIYLEKYIVNLLENYELLMSRIHHSSNSKPEEKNFFLWSDKFFNAR